MANHFRLDLHLVELLARVDADDASNHLGDDNHVTEVSLDGVGLLVGPGLLLGLSELLDETHGAALQATVDPAAGTGVDDIAELVGAEVEEAIGGDIVSVLGNCKNKRASNCRERSSVGKFHIRRWTGDCVVVGGKSNRDVAGFGRTGDVLLEVNTSVGKLAEGTALLELGGGLSVLYSR